MKILTILGTRPEIIRLSLIIKKLDDLVDHKLIHTGQNFDHNLSEVFFKELGIRKPDEFWGIQGKSAFDQIGQILTRAEELFLKEKPDRILILGDTNSGLTAFVAKRLGIPVFHMEAGNRCYDDRVPEESNRRVIDHSSDILLPYTERSRNNLLSEGFHHSKVYVTGNPIHEVINHYEPQISQSQILQHLQLNAEKYFLVTAHRAENVDDPKRLKEMIQSFEDLIQKYQLPVLVSTHPRTRSKLNQIGYKIDSNPKLRFLDPFGFFDFIHLEKNAFCVLSDSGTVQEECAIFKVPNVTLRESTERPETMECGSNIISSIHSKHVLRSVQATLTSKPWNPPPEYIVPNVSDIVVRIITSRQLCLQKEY